MHGDRLGPESVPPQLDVTITRSGYQVRQNPMPLYQPAAMPLSWPCGGLGLACECLTRRMLQRSMSEKMKQAVVITHCCQGVSLV